MCSEHVITRSVSIISSRTEESFPAAFLKRGNCWFPLVLNAKGSRLCALISRTEVLVHVCMYLDLRAFASR